jgi:DNA repair protein RadD
MKGFIVLELRDYQITAIADTRAAFTRHRRVLFVLPTGGGKTVIFAFITTHAAAKENRVVILAHRQEIADQIGAALAAMNVPHGRIQPGHDRTEHVVQIGMVQTVARRVADIPEPALLLIDEAHHAVAGTWFKIAEAWRVAKVLGVTATPERLDGVGLRDAFDTMVLGPDVPELIDAGYLAPFHYLAPSIGIDLAQVRSIGGDYNAGDLEVVLDQDSITGNVVDHYGQHLAGRTAIAFCVTIMHAEHVAQRFREAGIPAASIDGTMSSDQRHDLVNRLRAGELRVLTSCEIISEGFDAPAVGGAILLRPTESFALFRQQVGRCLRPKRDGSSAVILDHVGNVMRHGLPDAPHEWSLGSKKRTAAERQKAAVGCRVCPACSEVFATGGRHETCEMPDDPACLFRPRILPEREGVLQEITAAHSPPWARGTDIKRATGWQWCQLIQHAGTDPMRLRQIAEVRGYRRGGIRHAMQEALNKQQNRRGEAA